MLRGVLGSNASQVEYDSSSVSERSGMHMIESPSKPRPLSRSVSRKSFISIKLESLVDEEKSYTHNSSVNDEQPSPAPVANRKSIMRRLSRMISVDNMGKDVDKGPPKLALSPALAAWRGDFINLQDFLRKEPSLVLSKFTVGDGKPLLTPQEENDDRFIPPSMAPKNIRAALKIENPSIMTREQRWVLAKGFSESTLLHYACAGGSLACVQLLIDMGADRHALNGAQKPSEYYADRDDILQFIWSQDRRNNDDDGSTSHRSQGKGARASEHLLKLRAALKNNSTTNTLSGEVNMPDKNSKQHEDDSDGGSKQGAKSIGSRRMSRVLSARRLSRANLPTSDHLPPKDDDQLSDITYSVAPIPRPNSTAAKNALTGNNNHLNVRRLPPPPPPSAPSASAGDDRGVSSSPNRTSMRMTIGIAAVAGEDSAAVESSPEPPPRPVIMRRLSTVGKGQLQSTTTLTDTSNGAAVVIEDQRISTHNALNNSNGNDKNRDFQTQKQRAQSAPLHKVMRIKYSDYLIVIGATVDGLKYQANRVAAVRSMTPAVADLKRRKREKDVIEHMQPMEALAHKLLIQHAEQVDESEEIDPSVIFRRAQRSVFMLNNTPNSPGYYNSNNNGSESAPSVTEIPPNDNDNNKDQDITALPYRVMLWQQAGRNMNKGLFDGNGRNGRALGALRDEAYVQGSKALKKEFKSYADKDQWEAIDLLRNKALYALLALRKKREVEMSQQGMEERKSLDNNDRVIVQRLKEASSHSAPASPRQSINLSPRPPPPLGPPADSSNSPRPPPPGPSVRGTNNGPPHPPPAAGIIRAAQAGASRGRRKSTLDTVLDEVKDSTIAEEDQFLPKEERVLTTALRRLSMVVSDQPYDIEKELKKLQQRIDRGELNMVGRA